LVDLNEEEKEKFVVIRKCSTQESTQFSKKIFQTSDKRRSIEDNIQKKIFSTEDSKRKSIERRGFSLSDDRRFL
jgi:hypothetical protein